MAKGIIDSHVHFWPASMSNEQGHRWMQPGAMLATQHVLNDYLAALRRSKTLKNVERLVFVETDARYTSPVPDLATWTTGPLDEITFLREAFSTGNDQNILGATVLWAPMDQPSGTLIDWLSLAEVTAGPSLWKTVKGFRYLLQAIASPESFEHLMTKSPFVYNLRVLGKRQYSFDVGIDQNSGGIWQLEMFLSTIERTHDGVPEDEKTVFILNHLCKPDFSQPGTAFDQWRTVMSRLSEQSRTYMKLSGAFSELPSSVTSREEIVAHIKPWVKHILQCFGPERVMFGSDWPVCNVKGPAKEDSWSMWTEVVSILLDDSSLAISSEDKERLWRETAIEAYSIA